MENMEENEFLVSDEVLEDNESTSEEVIEETEAEQSQEEVVEEKTPTEEEIQERINNAVKSRLDRERRNNKELYQIEDTLKKALGVEDRKSIIENLKDFYKDNGIEVSDYRSERDEKILAKADAEEIIELGKEEMEAEANRIAGIPQSQRTVRETTMFDTLCQKLIEINDREELKAKGMNTEVLDTKSFKEFREQFNTKTSISKIVELYNKSNGTIAEKPKSPGSAKSTSAVEPIKSYYSPEDFDKLTAEDLRNPKIMEIVDKSRLQWFKKSSN